MATAHHQHGNTPSSGFPSHLQPHRTARAARRAGLLTGLVAATVLAVPAIGAAPAALASHGSTAARAAQEDAAGAVAEIAARVRDAEHALEQMTVEAEAASDAVLQAQADLRAAVAEAERTAAELERARAAADRMQEDVSTLGREAFMGEESYGGLASLLDSQGPGEALQRAATLELLGSERAETLEALEAVERAEADADRAARSAVAERDRATRAAAEIEKKAGAQLAKAQARYDALSADKARLDEQLKAAEIKLLAAQGEHEPARTWAVQEAAQDAAEVATTKVRSSGGGIAPTQGRVTSCYGARWGTMHYGVDIAAPIGTPVRSPEAGVVLDAGPASGFGLAVYVQHSDGSITLYGHVNRIFVSAGQTVTAGEVIAEVGNRGQSTGPHLHFEVHSGGLYADRADPGAWLAARGISLGGKCG